MIRNAMIQSRLRGNRPGKMFQDPDSIGSRKAPQPGGAAFPPTTYPRHLPAVPPLP